MGVFKVKAIIWNPLNRDRKISVNLIVDTGSMYTVLPASILQQLGIEPIRVAKLRLAGSRVVEKPLGEIGIEIEGYMASATPVVSGEEGVHLLGSVTMEQLGLAPDPLQKKLKPVEALMMQLQSQLWAPSTIPSYFQVDGCIENCSCLQWEEVWICP